MTDPASDTFARDTSVWDSVLKRFVDRPGVHGIVVGGGDGRTSRWLGEHVLTYESARLTCIDPSTAHGFAEAIDPVRHKARHVAASSSVALRGLSLAIGSIDFIHVDGGRSAPSVLEAAVFGCRLLKVGGLMIVDAVEAESARAMEQFLHVYANYAQTLRKDEHIVFQKRPPR
jgi:predicted O-methyltransferase YrrM